MSIGSVSGGMSSGYVSFSQASSQGAPSPAVQDFDGDGANETAPEAGEATAAPSLPTDPNRGRLLNISA